MKTSHLLGVLYVLGFIPSISTLVEAATITAVEAFTVVNDGTQPGCLPGSFCEWAMLDASGVNSIVTISPNNDEVGDGNLNQVSQKIVFSEPLGYVVTFRATNSGGVTEYLFEDLVANEGDFVGLPILTHRIDLQADEASSQSGVDFDFPDKDPAPTSSFSSGTIVHSENAISWRDGLAKFSSRTITYSLDLPDCGESSGIACNLDSNSYSFTMRHNVPLPPALWLLGSGLLGLVGIARSKKPD